MGGGRGWVASGSTMESRCRREYLISGGGADLRCGFVSDARCTGEDGRDGVGRCDVN